MNEAHPQWQYLMKLVEQFQHCEVIFKAQDGLPVFIVKIEGKREQIDLTKKLTE